LREYQTTRFYEMMVISTPEGTPEELLDASARVGSHVSSAGGTVIRASHDSPWGRRRLAYPIRHAGQDLRDGFYTLYHFEIDPAKISDIERELRLNERVIRHLLLQLDREPVFPEPEPEQESVEAEPEIAAEVTSVVDNVEATEAAIEDEADPDQVTEEVAADLEGDTAGEDATVKPEE
jgi:small subunit ribosomal protein S6